MWLAQYPFEFPFSVLDFGMTALTLVVMGVMTYLFIKYLGRERDSREVFFDKMSRDIVEAMKDITTASREIVSAAERHTEVSRGTMIEFHRLVEEHDNLRREFYISRDKMRELGDAFIRYEAERPR